MQKHMHHIYTRRIHPTHTQSCPYAGMFRYTQTHSHADAHTCTRTPNNSIYCAPIHKHLSSLLILSNDASWYNVVVIVTWIQSSSHVHITGLMISYTYCLIKRSLYDLELTEELHFHKACYLASSQREWIDYWERFPYNLRVGVAVVENCLVIRCTQRELIQWYFSVIGTIMFQQNGLETIKKNSLGSHGGGLKKKELNKLSLFSEYQATARNCALSLVWTNQKTGTQGNVHADP